MKHKARQSGPGGRLRLALLLVSAMAFLLVPVAAASALPPYTIEITGTGGGAVVGVPPLDGTPPVNCAYESPGPATGTCTGETSQNEGLSGVLVEEQAAAGSEFAGWTVVEGVGLGCEDPLASLCGVVTFGSPVVIKATFNLEPPKAPLTVTKTGSGSGTVTSSPAGINCGVDCEEEYVTEPPTLVTLTGTPATGSDPVVWESCPGTVNGENKCEVTMDEAKEAVASFDLESVPFTVEQEGEGTVQCNAEACAAAYDYGTEIALTATPEAEWALASLTGTGSAAGTCDKEAGTCEFTITAPSSVAVQFKSEALRDSEAGQVEGEVPQTTSIESECASVDLGEFLPGVEFDYAGNCGLVLTSTGAETQLSAEDESETHTGHLVQGSYFLPSALKAAASDSEAKGTGPGLSSLESPVTLLTFSEPISKDAATLEFSQHIGENDGLHHGVYAKTITLTLEQTTP